MGILIFVCQAPILWFSKRTSTVETSTFGSEIVAMKNTIELIEALRYKLCMFGIPLDGATSLLCNNQAVVLNCKRPELTLQKKHHSIAYHRNREAVAANIVQIAWEGTKTNLADIFTKLQGPKQREELLDRFMYMSEERRKRLDSIGFVWRLTAGQTKQQRQVRPLAVEGPKKKKIKLDDEAAQEDKGSGHEAWDSYFKQFCEFVKTYKHCNVPLQHSELGRWTEEQRQLYKGWGVESNLTDKQEAKLMAAGFDFVRSLNIPDDDDIYSI